MGFFREVFDFLTLGEEGDGDVDGELLGSGDEVSVGGGRNDVVLLDNSDGEDSEKWSLNELDRFPVGVPGRLVPK